MADDINLHLGRRLRQKRRILGLSQQQLAGRLSIRPQQIQKYECGTNKMSAERLWQIAEELRVPISYFYDGIESPKEEEEREDVLSRRETIELLQVYCQLADEPRQRLLDLVKTMFREYGRT